MLKLLLKKQLYEIFSLYFYDAKPSCAGLSPKTTAVL